MRKIGGAATCLALGITLLCSQPALCDFWGGDDVILAQILQNALLQLQQLQSILSSGQNTLSYIQEINRGINDSMQLARTLGLRVDPGLYREIHAVDQALGLVERVYGKTPASPMAESQRNTDQTVAEAISFNNDLNEYTARLDQVGEDIKSSSHDVSPGGAAKLTAESIGVLIHVMNQQTRAQGQLLKLQAQSLVMQNKKEKDQATQYLAEGQALSAKMTAINPTFQVPRF